MTAYNQENYVRWVQRSLNRIMGRALPVDGKDIGPWREALREFKLSWRIEDPGIADFQIGPTTQNQLIRLNHLNTDYREWLHLKLSGAGGPDTPGADERLVAAIRKFQGAHPPLKKDGWVGHATEAVLVGLYGEPPGGQGTPPKPVPEWLAIWNALPVQVRYARWISDLAAQVGTDKSIPSRTVPRYGWDPEFKHFMGILERNAKATPKLVHFYFTDLDVSRIAAADMPRVVQYPPKKAPGGGKLLDQEALRQVAWQMTSTTDLFDLTLGVVMTPEAFARKQEIFCERVFQTFKSIRSGFMKLAFLGSWGRQGFFDAKYEYILIIIATLSLREESVYRAFRSSLPDPSSWEAPAALGAVLGL